MLIMRKNIYGHINLFASSVGEFDSTPHASQIKIIDPDPQREIRNTQIDRISAVGESRFHLQLIAGLVEQVLGFLRMPPMSHSLARWAASILS